tara:strand:- start:910 stop:1677 length:768 start_codon:yes stop_codon:yes gene_type:complete
MSTYQDYINSLKENSMTFWWPKVKDLDIPMPETVMIDCSQYHDQFWSMLDGKAAIPLAEQIEKVVIEQFGYPCFIRGDQCAGKHQYMETCFIDDTSDTKNHYYQEHRIKYFRFHVYNLVEAALNGPGVLPDAFFVREFLELEYKFTAFHNLPIAKERRYFVKDGEVVCNHPYWPVESIRFDSYCVVPPDNWQGLLEELNTLSEEDKKILYQYSKKIAQILEGYWSVDFAKGVNGTWYFIDTAKGDVSFHWPQCQL